MVTDHLATGFPNLNLQIIFDPKFLVITGTLKPNIGWLAAGDFIVKHSDNFFTDNLFGQISIEMKPRIFLRACLFITDSLQNSGIFTISEDLRIISCDEKSLMLRL
jgi:hypothetical protein